MVQVRELSQILNKAFSGLFKQVQLLAIRCAVANGQVSLDHPHITMPALSCVPERSVLPETVMQIAVLLTRLTGEQ